MRDFMIFEHAQRLWTHTHPTKKVPVVHMIHSLLLDDTVIMSSGSPSAVFREWSPYGGPGQQQQDTNATPSQTNTDKHHQEVVFRGWSPSSPHQSSAELERLDQEGERLRRQLYELRESGRQRKLHRLQALDALETRRVTLTEILRRMEQELQDRDVYQYGDVLAEVFGERKIYAHRAVGLEALLCQYMHQMLAKQHQLKIMKKAGKDIENHYRKSKLHNKDDFHSFEALCVQLEASRLSLEDLYDSIFASQHRILAALHQVEMGGDGSNYSMSSPSLMKQKKQPTMMRLSDRHSRSDADDRDVRNSLSGDVSLGDDMETARGILSTPKHNDEEASEDDDARLDAAIKTASETAAAILANPTLRRTTNTAPPVLATHRRSEDGKTARERRREIEKKRMARPARLSTGGGSSGNYQDDDDDDDAHKARNRMRELEAKAKEKRDSVGGNDEDLKERTSKSSSTKSSGH
jgi:hypothetical protein